MKRPSTGPSPQARKVGPAWSGGRGPQPRREHQPAIRPTPQRALPSIRTCVSGTTEDPAHVLTGH